MIQHTPDETVRIVERLMGSADPELSCEECFDFLDVYVERELAGTTRLAGATIQKMDAHLRSCPACRDDHDSLLALLVADRSEPA
jgi:hypothetical protein